MKPDIHPDYHDITVTCSCGNSFVTRSTLAKKSIIIEVCSMCHPFYTGTQKLLDTGGRVDKFRLKYARSKEPAEKPVKEKPTQVAVPEKKIEPTKKVEKKQVSEKKPIEKKPIEKKQSEIKEPPEKKHPEVKEPPEKKLAAPVKSKPSKPEPKVLAKKTAGRASKTKTVVTVKSKKKIVKDDK